MLFIRFMVYKMNSITTQILFEICRLFRFLLLTFIVTYMGLSIMPVLQRLSDTYDLYLNLV